MFRVPEARFRIIEKSESALDNFCNLLLLPPRLLALSFATILEPTHPPFVLGLSADRGLRASIVECCVSSESILDSQTLDSLPLTLLPPVLPDVPLPNRRLLREKYPDTG